MNTTIEKQAANRATVRARSARWDLNIAIFLSLILILVIILLFQGIGISFVAPTAIFGLTFVWLIGWQRGKKLYMVFYKEELLNLKRESAETTVYYNKAQKTVEETIAQQVEKAFRERRLDWD